MESKTVSPSLNAFSDGELSYKDRDALFELYVVHELTTRDIGSLFGVHHVTIVNWLDKHNISVPDERQHRRPKHDALSDRKELCELYIDDGLKASEIADRVGCGKSLVVYWLNRHDIETRTKSDYVGERSAAWEGGGNNGFYRAVADNLQGASWPTISRKVRSESEGCEMCGARSSGGRGLDVHHIVPLFAGGTNDEYNFMTLCRSCHITVESFTREHIDRYILNEIQRQREIESQK